MQTGQNVQLLANLSAGATGAQAGVIFQLGPKVGAVVHVDIGGTGTVSIEGRLDPSAAYQALGAQLGTTGAFSATITASGVYLIPAACVDMRANVTANSTTMKVWVQA